MIALTGATGNIGRHLAQLLATASIPARLLVRDPAKADTFSGVLAAIAADFDHPDTFVAALTGVTAFFLLSPGPNTPTQDAAAIAAAQRAGVRHIVLLSSLGIEAGGVGGGRPHEPGESVLKNSGLDWTILRPSEFMSNTLAWLPEIRARGTISVPTGDGAVALIAPRDIAAVAFAAFTTPNHIGHTYRLTGPELLTTAAIAVRLSTVLGTPIQHVDVTNAEFLAAAQQAHMPDPLIALFAEYYVALKQGRMALQTDDVAQVTGRPATPYLEWARTAILSA